MRERLIELIEKTTRETRRHSDLEKLTGISASSWKQFYIGRQRPTDQMIEALCSAYPQCVLWITTAKTDEQCGQIDIDAQLALREIGLKDILSKPARGWTTKEAKVARVNLAMAQFIDDNRDRAKFVQPLSEQLEEYDAHVNQRVAIEKPNQISDGSPPPVQVKRVGQETYVTIKHTINLREPLSPANFEWGYVGTGPRQLAANVLNHFGCTAQEARLLADDFCRDVISKLNSDLDFVNDEEVKTWIKRKGQSILKKYTHGD